jgi:hypothetical protein
MTDKPYYIQELSDIYVKNGEYWLKIKEPLKLNIYNKETEIESIPLGIYTQDYRKTITLGETKFLIEFSQEENDSRFLVEYDHNIILGPNEKKKILQYVISIFIDKQELIPDYSKKEDFYDPENIPIPSMAQRLMMNVESTTS